MGRTALGSGVLIAVCVTVTSTASARPASTGWFAEGAFGAVGLLPSASKDASIGPAIEMRVGHDLFPWLSFGISLAASSHEATVPAPPVGEWFQLYRGGADLRIGGLIDKVAVFVEGGAGAAMISSNVLEKVKITDPGERLSIMFQAGAGFEYQLENRHYAVGAGVDVFLLPQFATLKAIDGRVFLRYTY